MNNSLKPIQEAYINMLLESEDNPLTDYDWAVHKMPHSGETSVNNPNGPLHGFYKTKEEADSIAAKFNKDKRGHTFHVVPNKYKKSK